jgi:hypothetical protein
MAGLQTSLRAAGQVQVVCMESLGPNSEEQVKILHPGAIVFDSLERYDQDWPRLARLVKDNPSLVLLGMDAASSDLIVLSGERHTINNLDDIVHVIEARSQR